MNFMLGVQGISRALNNNTFSRHPDYCFAATTVTYRTLRTPHLKNRVTVVCRRGVSVRALLPLPRGLAEVVAGARSIAFRRAT